MVRKETGNKEKAGERNQIAGDTKGYGIVECSIILMAVILLVLFFRQEIIWLLQGIFQRTFRGR